MQDTEIGTSYGHGARVGVPYVGLARDHEILNRVVFTPSQAELIESERPVDGVPEPTGSGYELAAYRMPNGSRFVTLFSKREDVWEAYCMEQATRAISLD